MPDPKPLSPYALTPARITILVLGILAVVMIVGGILGGVQNYQLLRESTSSASSTASSSAQ